MQRIKKMRNLKLAKAEKKEIYMKKQITGILGVVISAMLVGRAANTPTVRRAAS
jgi:hypothetical protein